ncbi:tyrosine-type recombinase/integrase [Lactococcus garvieae]|uniref:tyrosine-type recombinase/integrase n=1 Tax=Lactococcus garvieae TaxID=1363 RepID=UPI003D77703C
MFYKKLENGKYRFFEKYFDENQNKWRQVTVTMNSKSRASQAEAKSKLNKKIENYLSESDKKRTTVYEVFVEWRKVRNEEIKISTCYVEENAFRKFLRKYGNREITNITSQEIQFFLFDLKVSKATRRLRKTYYKLFFGYAVGVGYIKENPIDKIVLPKSRVTLEEVNRKQNKFLTLEEMKELLVYISKYKIHKEKGMLFEFLFLTGLRIGEALALRWQNVDTKNKVIEVHHTLNFHSHVANERLLPPKTIYSYRTVSINDRCIEILKHFHERNPQEDFLFLNNRGGIFDKNNLNLVFKKFCQECLGKENKNRKYSLHMLRHSHITLLVEMNVPIKVIMERVGHSNEKMILQVYSHVTQNMREDLSDKLNNLSI